MKIKPEISVIMSVYNEFRFLKKSIESILNQSFSNFEFIIIDDCSTDKSLKIIKEYQKKDKRIKIILNKKNLGLTKSLNKGLKKAKGKYIARMDADDISLPKRLEIQYKFLEKNKEIFLLGGGAINIDENDDKITVFRPICNEKKLRKVLITKRNAISHPTIMFRNNNHIFYREKMWYVEDYDLYLRLLFKDKGINNIKDKLIKYRASSTSICRTKAGHQKLFAEKAKLFYQQRLKQGQDEYESFDPDQILKINVNRSDNKLFLEGEIEASFKKNDFNKCREFLKRYFKNYGAFNKYLLYYATTFLPLKIIIKLRKIIFC